MKCRCIDKECQTIADAVGVIERYESILGDGDKKKSTIRAVDPKVIEGHMSERAYQSNLQALQDRIAKLEQGHGNRDTKRTNTFRCYSCNSPDHFMRNYPHKNNQSRARVTSRAIKDTTLLLITTSGATASILSIGVNEKIPSNVWCSLVPNKFEIFDVNGINVFAIGSITLELKLGQEIFSQNFMICSINLYGILRQDFLLKERFVKGFAAIARPMHKICEKNSRYAWNDECQRSFEQLKNALTSTNVLAYPLPNLPFILATDASDEAVGAVLSQIQDGFERVIYCSIHEQIYEHTRAVIRLLVPKSQQKTVFKYSHDVPSAGHLGPDTKLSRLFYWPAMKRLITRLENTKRKQNDWVIGTKCPKELVKGTQEEEVEQEPTSRSYSPTRPTIYEGLALQKLTL
ncbi:unnamed protein product [Mytilus coruscus]|uniref:Reverse transcriptase/retrotransposon-derived protein RNase H-like domain-containing protein n=1 Tax=Mytilus coruscus TaxID=42192 RepID=A0A6J8BQU5_MYTCO|nr:unnamed protein product [Mytilus coruscus]